MTVLAVPDALAAPRWSRPAVVAHTCGRGIGTTLQAAQNARGDALVAWVERYCGVLDDGRWRVVAVSKKAGHRFGRPRILHSGVVPFNQQLRVALDARGGATVAWTREPAYSSTAFRDPALFVTTRRPGKRFGRLRRLDDHAMWPDLATNAAGETVLAWHRIVPLNTQARAGAVVAATRAAGSTRFGPAQTLSGPLAGVPAVAIAPDGTAIASWARSDGSADDCCSAVEAAIRLPGGRFGPPVVVSPATPELNQSPTVSVAGRSAGTVSWSTSQVFRWPPHEQRSTGVYASRWDGHAFSAPVALVSSRGEFFSSPSVLGLPAVTWTQGGNQCTGLGSVYAVIRSSGTPVRLSPPNGMQSAFEVSFDSRDRLIAAWLQVTSVNFGKYNNCSINGTRIGGSIDAGPTIHGAAVKGNPGAVELVAAPGSRPRLFWTVRGQVVMSTLRG